MATVVGADQTAPFSIATTLRCRGGRYPFPWIAPLYLDTNLILLSVRQGGVKYNFLKSLVWRDLVLNSGLLNHWQTLYPLNSRFILMIHSNRESDTPYLCFLINIFNDQKQRKHWISYVRYIHWKQNKNAYLYMKIFKTIQYKSYFDREITS